MNSSLRLPLSPAPPHDPYALLLAGGFGPNPRAGWRVRLLKEVEIAGGKELTLSPTPDAVRLAGEASGSFGGRRLPSHVAVGPQGDIYLLDHTSGEVKRFDPCCCRFEPVPCFTRAAPPSSPCKDVPPGSQTGGMAPLTELADPHTIAVHDGHLFLSDTGHSRVVRASLNGMAVRDALRLPLKQVRATWRPTGLAFSRLGVLHVSDPVNGRLDRFSPDGYWRGGTTGLEGITHIAVDCVDRVLAVIETEFPAPALAPDSMILEAIATESHQWIEARLRGITGPLATFDMDVHADDKLLTPQELLKLEESSWIRWLRGMDLRAEGRSFPLPVLVGRALFFRLRVPAGMTQLPSMTLTARGARMVRVSSGAPETLNLRADDLEDLPPPGQVRTGADGTIWIDCDGKCEPFDLRGQRVPEERRQARPRHQREGVVLSQALDSSIDGCQWHRVEVRGTFVPGTSVAVCTFTSPIELSAEEIDDLPPGAWDTRQTLTAAGEGAVDCLITSPPGRFLWLRLTLNGDGFAAPRIRSLRIEFPRISLRRYLPAVFGTNPAGADFTDRFTALFDATLRSIERHVDSLPRLFDPRSAPARPLGHSKVDFLSWIGRWIGVTLERDWPEARRRWFVRQAAKLYCMRGTPHGLWRQLLLFLGFDRAHSLCLDEGPRPRCVPLPDNCPMAPPRSPAVPPPLILEHFKLGRWLYAGRGRLGDDSVLWGKRIVNRSELSGGMPANQSGNARVGETQLGSLPDPLRDPFHVYAQKFSIFVPARVRDRPSERRGLEQLLAREAPAHTQFDVQYVEPRFRVGQQAMIGFDAVVARTPRGVPLDPKAATAKRLSQGSVLTGSPHRGRAPRVGEGRVGTNTVLD